jgi:methionyl-tRNA formyltransferase
MNAAILNGDSQTGITIQSLALEMDAGDIIAQEVLPLSGTETAESLTESAAQRGASLLVQALDLIAAGKEKRAPQDSAGVSYCGLLTKEQGKIAWKDSAIHIERMVRAFDPWPGAWTAFNGVSLRILAAKGLPENSAGGAGPGVPKIPGKVLGVDTQRGILVQTGDGLLAVCSLQLQSKKAMNFASFMNGVRGFTGSVLGDVG